jgi:hypothetical protein
LAFLEEEEEFLPFGLLEEDEEFLASRLLKEDEEFLASRLLEEGEKVLAFRFLEKAEEVLASRLRFCGSGDFSGQEASAENFFLAASVEADFLCPSPTFGSPSWSLTFNAVLTPAPSLETMASQSRSTWQRVKIMLY